jgi:hypothetical protein
MFNPLLMAVGVVAMVNAALLPKARMVTLCYCLVCVANSDWATWAFLTVVLMGSDFLCTFRGSSSS